MRKFIILTACFSVLGLMISGGAYATIAGIGGECYYGLTVLGYGETKEVACMTDALRYCSVYCDGLKYTETKGDCIDTTNYYVNNGWCVKRPAPKKVEKGANDCDFAEWSTGKGVKVFEASGTSYVITYAQAKKYLSPDVANPGNYTFTAKCVSGKWQVTATEKKIKDKKQKEEKSTTKNNNNNNNNNSQYKIPKENCECKKDKHNCFVEAESCKLQQKGEWVCNKDYDGYDCCYCKGGKDITPIELPEGSKKKQRKTDGAKKGNNSGDTKKGNNGGGSDDDLAAYSCIEHDPDLGAFSVFFGNAEHSRDEECKAEIIKQVTPFLNQVNKTDCVYIVGYADTRNSSGSFDNEKLSRDRVAWVRGLFSSYDAKFRTSEAGGDASTKNTLQNRYASEPQQRRVDIIYGQCIENNEAKKKCHEMMAQGKAVRWDDERKACMCEQENYGLNDQGECVELLDVAKKREEEALAAARSESRARIISAGRTLDSIKAGFDTSVWKNKDGGFNTARLASDSIAGVVLGTAGGLITSNIIKKNQIKGGFEDIKCTIGGQTVADWGDEFQAGISLNGNY